LLPAGEAEPGMYPSCSPGVERARDGEKIGITRREDLAAVLVPAVPETSLKDIFVDIEKIRKRAKLSRRANVRDLIEDGRT